MQRAPLLLGFVGVAIVAAIVAGLMIVSGPAERRREKLDKERLENISRIAEMIHEYSGWGERALPETWNEEYPEFDKFWLPLDPETGQFYEYERLGEKEFRLCANFTSRDPQQLANTWPRIRYLEMAPKVESNGSRRGCASFHMETKFFTPLRPAPRSPARP